tara:strand:+ start:5508 stop:5756 length:249 start_codon:yes stop_codon:yes gene_type:complete
MSKAQIYLLEQENKRLYLQYEDMSRELKEIIQDVRSENQSFINAIKKRNEIISSININKKKISFLQQGKSELGINIGEHRLK